MSRKNGTLGLARILVIDDEKSVLESLNAILAKEGYSAEGATTKAEVISKLKKNRYDICVVDYHLEHETSEHIIDTIRNFTKFAFIIVVADPGQMTPVRDLLTNYDIQAFCDKEEDFRQLLIHLATAIKTQRYVREVLLNSNFGDRLKMLREHVGYSQEDLAALIGVHRGTIIDYEKGSSYPSYEKLIKLSEKLGTDMNFLTGRFINIK